MALIKSQIFQSSYEQLDNFIFDNINNLTIKQREQLGKILPQLATETNKLNRLKEKEYMKDILISSLSRLLQNKDDFLNTLTFNLQELFNLSSIAFLDMNNKVLSLISYGEDNNKNIKKRINKNLKYLEQFSQYNTNEDSYNIYYISIYNLDTKIATLYFERELSLRPNDFEMVEEICDITGNLYNQVLLYTDVELKKNRINQILNSQTNFTIITDGLYIKEANKTMLNFFNYTDLDTFHNEHHSISDFFIQEDGYLQKTQDGKSWLNVILEDITRVHLVKIIDTHNKEHIFQINTTGKKIEEEEEEEEEVYVITFTDITEIEKQNTYISSILQASDEIQIILDDQETIIDFSNEANSVFKTIRKSITLGEFLEEEEEEEEVKQLREFLIQNKNGINTTHISHLKNRYFKVVYKIISEDNRMIIFYDVTELENQRHYISSLLEVSDEGQIIIDKYSNIKDFNPQAHKIFRFIRKNITIGKLFEEEEEEEEAGKLKSFINNIAFDYNHTHIFKHQNEYYKVKYKYLSDDTHIILFQDITELMKLHNTLEDRISNEVQKNREKDIRLFETAKMASMGEMIANIAHQWRQPLNSITSTTADLELQIMMDDLNNDNLQFAIDSINKRVQYLSTTIDTFRDFIKEKKEYKSIIIEDRIKTVVNIVATSLKDNYIELIEDIDYCKQTKLEMVTGELDQVVINILNNAKDILKEKKVENPWIKLSLKTIDKMLVISIEDNGGGVPNAILSKIFDPYFTTKHQSQGTGLGLHMSKKIVHDSLGGVLEVQNTQNGAKFTIELKLK